MRDDDGDDEKEVEKEQQKQQFMDTHTFDHIVKLNVGGTLFTTSTATLTSCPDTMLGAMFSGRHALPKDEETGAHFIDRDGTHFREILNFLRAPTVYKIGPLDPKSKVELEREAEFYGLRDVMFPPFVPQILRR